MTETHTRKTDYLKTHTQKSDYQKTHTHKSNYQMSPSLLDHHFNQNNPSGKTQGSFLAAVIREHLSHYRTLGTSPIEHELHN